MNTYSCRYCKNWHGSELDFQNHHLQHIQKWPVVVMKKLAKRALKQIEKHGYYRFKQRGKKVTPLKITVKKNDNGEKIFVTSEIKQPEFETNTMIGLNGISIQRKNGKNLDLPVLPSEETPTATENPIDLLEKLSGSGISIGKKSTAKPQEPALPEKSPDETAVVAEPPAKPVDAPAAAESTSNETENMVSFDPNAIDILRKMLLEVPPPNDSTASDSLPQIEADDEVIIEDEIPRTVVTADNVPAPETASSATSVSNADVPQPELPTSSVSSEFPVPDIRSGTMGQTDVWSRTAQDPLISDCENFIQNYMDTNEYMSLEQFDQGLQKQAQAQAQAQAQNRLPAPPRPPQQQQPSSTGKIRVIPQQHMQLQRPPRMMPPPAPSMPPPQQMPPPPVALRMPPPVSAYDNPMPSSSSSDHYNNYSVYSHSQNYPPMPQYPRPQRGMRAARPKINIRPLESMAASRMPAKRMNRMPAPRSIPQKMPRMTAPGALPQQTSTRNPAAQAANALASRGITVTANRPNKAPGPITNHNVQRPAPCSTVDLTADEPTYPCSICRKEFSTMASLEAHKSLHRRSATFSSTAGLQRTNHPPPQRISGTYSELGIPVVNVALPSTQMLLARAGITSYIPLSNLQSQPGMQFALPVIGINTQGNKATAVHNNLGANNVLALGKLMTLRK